MIFFIPSVEMVLKIPSLLDKWELKEKYVPKCLEIKSRKSCEEIGRITTSKKTWEEERKVCIKGIIPRPSTMIGSNWQLNKCLIYSTNVNFPLQRWIPEGPSKGIICSRAGSSPVVLNFAHGYMKRYGDFPGGPVAKSLPSRCWGPGFSH